jgi:hypothetical protein
MKPLVVTSVWAAEFCCCHYEAGFSVLGLFRRREDARRVLREHREEYLGHGRRKRQSWQHWRVQRHDVQ